MGKHVSISGLAPTIEAFKLLPREVKSPLRGGLFAAGKVIRDEARKNAPVGRGTPMPGNMRKQIFLARDRNPGALGLAEHYFISVRTGRRGLGRLRMGQALRSLTGNDAWYWVFVEFGTSKQKAQAPIRRAFESQAMRALEVFKREFQKGVPRAADRANRKAGIR